jgi:DNA invertase Pin-like site-specific DNA recombinase
MRTAIYARYSSENQRPESTEDQIAACRRLATQRNWTIVEDQIYTDEAQSGARRDRQG